MTKITETVTDIRTGRKWKRRLDLPSLHTKKQREQLASAEKAREKNSQTTRKKLLAALETNRKYCRKERTTPAQDRAQFVAMAKQINGIIRTILSELDDVD